MTKVIARIVIDMDDWDDAFPHPDNRPVLIWRRSETALAQPFTASEVALNAAAVDDLSLG